MAAFTIQVDDGLKATYESFRPVAEAVIGEEIDDLSYASLVVDQGIRRMISDIVGDDPGVLRDSIIAMHRASPEFVAAFMREVLTRPEASENARRRLGFV